MNSQHNNISKAFDQQLYESTKVKPEWVKKIFPVINIVIPTKEDYGIDSYWMFKDNVVAGIEWEQATQKSWGSYTFPYFTCGFLTRKDKYANLVYPAFFIRVNSDCTNAYCFSICSRVLRPEYIKPIVRTGKSIAKDGETRYEIPIEGNKIVFGLDEIEPYIVRNVLGGRKNEVEQYEKYLKIKE
jgi:hypothetical protein